MAVRRMTLIPVMAVMAALLPLTAMPHVWADDRPADALPAQATVDGAQIAGGFGGWAALDGGVAARPEVTSLSVRTGAKETVAIVDGEAVEGSGLTAVVRPVGLCPDGPRAGLDCSGSPRHLEISVGYLDGEVSRADLAGSTSPKITAASIVDLTVNLHSLSPRLRWTWASGEPTFWSVEGIGTEEAILHIRFHPGARPVAASRGACTVVPVKKGCEAPRADHVERQAALVVSFDDAVNQAFAGALIASDGAYAGSLVTEYPANEDYPTIGVSVAAPSTVKAASARARVWAFLGEATLLNDYAILTDQGRVPSFFKATLANGKSTRGVQSWTRWTQEKQGSDGWLIEAPATRPEAAIYDGKADRSKSSSLVLGLQRKYAWAAFARKANDTVNVIISASEGALAKVCRSKTCRVTISRSESRLGTKLVDISHREVEATRGVFFAMLTLDRQEAKGIMVNDPLITVVDVQTRQGWERLASGVIRVDKPL
jgi:hypothetical protein